MRSVAGPPALVIAFMTFGEYFARNAHRLGLVHSRNAAGLEEQYLVAIWRASL
jgi:hypothetical protein